MLRYMSFFLGCCLLTLSVQAQEQIGEVLSLEQAIDLAIKNNDAIRIQRLQTQVAANNVFKANAGQLPTVNALANASYTNTFSNLDLRTFQPDPPEITIEESGVQSLTASIGVQADYVLFDGGSGKLRYALLETLSDVAQAQQELLISEVVMGVSQFYLELLKVQNQITFLQENIDISKERLQKMRDRAEWGQANQLAILTAETNLRQDESSLENVLLIKANLAKELNYLMGIDVLQTYQVQRDYKEPTLPLAETVVEDIQRSNPEMQLVKRGISVAASQLNVAKAAPRPVVSSFANVNYFFQKNDVQQLAQIQNIGPTVGLAASYNLFDGGVNKNRIQNAQIGVAIEQERQIMTQDRLMTDAQKEMDNIVLLKGQLDREKANLTTFEQAFEKVQDQFYAGKANALDLRDAQLARLNVLLRIDQLEVDLLLSDLTLNRVRGRLVSPAGSSN